MMMRRRRGGIGGVFGTDLGAAGDATESPARGRGANEGAGVGAQPRHSRLVPEYGSAAQLGGRVDLPTAGRELLVNGC